ncbi:sugar phosphate isomerase/epimerase family protein [Lactococcus raffinolactis]|uniref:sugar phosphate isomerase/epimerase family protein n=1 Tax=Pseudolactococcus raffinolactis TaxID=1366 RepID=UPI0039AFF824
MINLAVRGHDLAPINGIEDLAQKIQGMGISNVQLSLPASFPNLPSDTQNINPGLGTYIKNAFADSAIQIAILSCYINIIHPDLEMRETLLKKFESYVKNAKYFGATMVATETGNVFEEIQFTEDNFTDDVFEMTIQVIKRLVEVGENHQTLIGIEPGLNHPLHTIQSVSEMISRVPSDFLGIILDVTNLICIDTYQNYQAILEEAFEAFGDKIIAIHLKDFKIDDGKIIPVDLGTGLLDIKNALDFIKQRKPYLYIVMEETKNDAISEAKKLVEGHQ